MKRLLRFRLLEQVVPHTQHQRLVAGRKLARLDGFFQAAAHFIMNGLGRVIVPSFQLGNGQRQVTTQITAGKQFIVTGVLYHAIN